MCLCIMHVFLQNLTTEIPSLNVLFNSFLVPLFFQKKKNIPNRISILLWL